MKRCNCNAPLITVFEKVLEQPKRNEVLFFETGEQRYTKKQEVYKACSKCERAYKIIEEKYYNYEYCYDSDQYELVFDGWCSLYVYTGFESISRIMKALILEDYSYIERNLESIDAEEFDDFWFKLCNE